MNKKNGDNEQSPWMTTSEAANYLRKTSHTLEIWRIEGKHPELKFSKKGKDVRYWRAAVENFYSISSSL